MSENSFWIRAQEEKLANDEIFYGLSQKFSSKPTTKKTDDSIDKLVLLLFVQE